VNLSLDLVFVILLVLLTLRGFLKGFTGEFFSLTSLALGLIAAVFFFKNGAEFLRARYFQNIALLPEILAFFGIFLIVFIAGKILEHIIKDIINRLNLNGLDKVLGLALGLAEALALISLVLLLLIIQPLFDSKALLESSIFARLFLPLIGVFRV
jgi:membrane protein required for colicin V production